MRRGILADSDTLDTLNGRITREPFNAIYEKLEQRCALILETAPIGERTWRAEWQRGRWGAALNAARTAQGRLIDLIIADRIDPNRAYRDRAIEELMTLVAWSVWEDPCHRAGGAGLGVAESAVAAVVSLDWLWEYLSEKQRSAVKEAILDKAIRPYLKAIENDAWWYTCYHNWNAVVNGGVGLAALALSDESEEAARAYELATAGLEHVYDALGKEGGWDEGTGYWAYTVRYLLLHAEAARNLADDESFYHRRGMDATGLFPVYFCPHGHSASFGDAPGVPLYGALYLLVRDFDAPELCWWLDTYSFHRDVSTTGWSAAGLALLFRPEEMKPPAAPGLEPVKVFQQIGWAALADQWPRPHLYVAAKTGDLAANHSQRDMNSIQVMLDGEMFLTDLGSPEYPQEYLDENERGEFYEVQARSHNTLALGGHDHIIDAQGRIAASDCTPRHRWVACDGGNALGENVRFIRHVVMCLDEAGQTGQTLIVVDEVSNAVPQRLELFWHSLNPMKFDAVSGLGTITTTQHDVHFALASSSPVVFSGWAEPVSRGRTDHVASAKVEQGDIRTIFVSVFTDGQLDGEIAIEEGAKGALDVRANGAMLRFKPGMRHLTLSKVDWSR